MKSNTIIIIFLAFIGMSNGQEQFKTGNSWNYFDSSVTIGGKAQCIPIDGGGGISIKILSAISKVDGSIDFTAQIKDTLYNYIDTGEYLYKNDSVSGIKHTSPYGGISNQIIGYLVVPNGLSDTAGYYKFLNIPYTILKKESIDTSLSIYGMGSGIIYYYLQSIGMLYNYSYSGYSENGSECVRIQSTSLKAFNNVFINSDSLFQYLQTPIKNGFQDNQSFSSPLISIKKDGNRIISRSIKFVGTARVELIDLQGRRLISRDLVFTHNDETAVFPINKLPEGLYIVNAYEKGTAKKIVSIKIIL